MLKGFYPNMNNYIKLPNALLSCHLCPLELAVWMQLASHANRLGGCTVRQQTIADRIGCGRQAVNRAIARLKEKGLVSSSARFGHSNGQRRRLCDSYVLAPQQGSYTCIPVEVLYMGLAPAELAVYAYHMSCRNHSTLEAMPSLRQIAGALGMGISSVTKANRALEARGLSYKEQYIRQDRSFGHNRYTVITPALLRVLAQYLLLRAKQGIKKQTTRLHQAVRRMSAQLIKSKDNYIVTNIIAAVKRFFYFLGIGVLKLRQ